MFALLNKNDITMNAINLRASDMIEAQMLKVNNRIFELELLRDGVDRDLDWPLDRTLAQIKLLQEDLNALELIFTLVEKSF
mgnify:CR=1 FL=1|tara:strand:+ start:1187 stop:1429 length:243 start_codon:yes stop_codon:yes gene_type:complete